MKPTEFQSTQILEALACLRVGNDFVEEIIAQWEAIRPPDPVTTFGDPPAGYTWHNPENLTPEQVGVADGWRLCLVGETASSGCEQSHPRGWVPFGYSRAPFGKGYVLTYRTKDPLPDPAPTAEETERAAFEAWWVDAEITGDHKGFAFEAWKAAHNQTQKP